MLRQGQGLNCMWSKHLHGNCEPWLALDPRKEDFLGMFPLKEDAASAGQQLPLLRTPDQQQSLSPSIISPLVAV